MGFLRHLPGASFKNVFWITILFLSVSYSQQYVESILYESPPKRPSKQCKDCDIVQLPDGSYFFNKCDPYSKEKCGLDNLKDYDCCVGYQLKRKSRLLTQPRDVCNNDTTPWSRCFEQMTVNADYRPYVKALKEMFMSGKLKMDQKYTVFIAKGEEPDVDNKESSSLTVVKGKYFSHDMYEGLKMPNALLANEMHQTTRGGLKLFMDCIEVLETDKECPNGAVHMLSEPIKLPARKEPCDGDDAGRWKGYLKECDLYTEKGASYTYLYPLDSSFDWWEKYEPFKKEYERFMKDKEYRCRTVRFHIIASGKEPMNNLKEPGNTVHKRTTNKDPQLWQSLYQGPDDEKDELWYHYGRVQGKEPVASGSDWIVKLNRVLVIPEYKIKDYVGSRDDLSITKKLLDKSKYDTSHFLPNEPRNLYLVTTNDKLADMFDADGNSKSSGAWDAELGQKYHSMMTVRNYIWGGDIGYFSVGRDYKQKNNLDRVLIFRRDAANPKVMMVGYEGLDQSKWPKVIEFNHRAMDGIVWVLDGAIPFSGECDTSGRLVVKGAVPECLEPYKVDKWWEYLKECDLYRDDDKNYSLLFPTNDAFDESRDFMSNPWYKERYERFLKDKNYRCEVLRYHVFQAQKTPNLATEPADLPNAHRTNNRGEYAPLWECASKSKVAEAGKDVSFNGAVVENKKKPVQYKAAGIFITDRVNMIPDQNITELVKSRDNMKVYTEIQTEGNSKKYFGEDPPNNVHLVVNDTGIKLDEVDAEYYDKFIRLHTMNVPCTNVDLLDDKEDSFTNGLGFPLITRIERSGSDPKKYTVYIGYEGLEKVKWSKVVRYEGPTRDGAVWTLDKPLLCPEEYCPVKTKKCDMATKIDYRGKVPDCLIPYSVDRWWNYLKECDLYMVEGKRYHVLFPVNSALDWWSEYKPFQEEYNRFMNNKEYRCAVVRYHVMFSEKEPTINFPKINETVHFLSNNRQPYSPVWQSLYFAPTELVNQGQTEYKYHYGRVMDQTPFTFARSWITRLDKVIMLPERNITDFLKSRSDLSITYNMVKKTDMGKYFERNAPKTLYLVERNERLKELFDEEVRIQKPIPEIPTHEASDSQKVDELKNAYRDNLDATFNQGYAYNFSLWHTVPNYMWGGDIGYFEVNQLYYMENARNFELMVKRVNIDGKDILKIGYEGLAFANWSTVIEFNHYARDGMVWVLDRRLTCPDKQCIPNVKLDVDIYTLTVAACRTEDLEGKEVDKKTFSKKMDAFADQYPEDCTNIFVNDYKNIGIVED